MPLVPLQLEDPGMSLEELIRVLGKMSTRPSYLFTENGIVDIPVPRPHVPQVIWDLVFEELHWQSNLSEGWDQTRAKWALDFCTRVCKAWTPTCQSYIFRTVTVTEQAHINKLNRIMDKSPHIAGYVRELILDGSELKPSSHYAKLLRRLGAVETVGLLSMDFRQQSSDPAQAKWAGAIADLLARPTVHRLIIALSRFISAQQLVNLVSHAKSLTGLRLGDAYHIERAPSASKGCIFGDLSVSDGERRPLLLSRFSVVLGYTDYLLSALMDAPSVVDFTGITTLIFNPSHDRKASVIQSLFTLAGSTIERLKINFDDEIAAYKFPQLDLSALTRLDTVHFNVGSGYDDEDPDVGGWLHRTLETIPNPNRLERIFLWLRMYPISDVKWDALATFLADRARFPTLRLFKMNLFCDCYGHRQTWFLRQNRLAGFKEMVDAGRKVVLAYIVEGAGEEDESEDHMIGDHDEFLQHGYSDDEYSSGGDGYSDDEDEYSSLDDGDDMSSESYDCENEKTGQLL